MLRGLATVDSRRRLRRGFLRGPWALPLVLLLLGPQRLAAQTFSISGVVIDSLAPRAIVGATVVLSGRAPVASDADGAFRIDNVRPGRYVLSMEAPGYRYRALDLAITSDTTLRVHLDRLAVLLDPTIARAGNVTVRGVVRDENTLAPVMQGRVILYPGGRSAGTITGGFVFENAPAGEPITIIVEALEYQPTRVTLSASRDTSIEITLAVDSVGRRLIAQQVRRLEMRSRGVARSLNALNRTRIEQRPEPTIGDLVRHLLPPDAVTERWPYKVGCVTFDDIPVAFDVLVGLPREVVERVEIYGARGSMIRVYSKRYVASLMSEEILPLPRC